MMRVDHQSGLITYLPSGKGEDGLTAEEVKVLEFIKTQITETGLSVHINKIILEFGTYHRRLETKVWHCDPVQQLLDKGTIVAVKFDTPAISS